MATLVGLGCARLGSTAGGGGWRESIRLVHAAIDHGVRYFDTADAYGAGASEHLLGRALRGRRPTVVVATKGGYRFTERGTLQRRLHAAAGTLAARLRTRSAPTGRRAATSGAYADQDFTPRYLTGALEASLRRLGTDHVDVYQLHGPRHADPDDLAAWGARMIADGKIGRLGVGAEDVGQAGEWLGCSGITAVQVPFGLLDVDAGSEVIPRAHATGRLVAVRGVLGAGLLTSPDLAIDSNAHKLPLILALRAVADGAGVGIASLAVDFVRSRPDVDTMIVGTRSAHHLAEIAARAHAPLPDLALLTAVDDTLAAQSGAG